MFSRRSRHIFVVALVTLSLAAAGCNSGGSDSDNNATDDVSQPDNDNGNDSSGGSSGNASGFNSGDCEQLRDALNNSQSNPGNLRDAADFFRQAAREAPDEVAGDLETIADTYDAIISDPTQAAAVSTSADFIEATTSLGAFLTESCTGLDLDN